MHSLRHKTNVPNMPVDKCVVPKNTKAMSAEPTGLDLIRLTRPGERRAISGEIWLGLGKLEKIGKKNRR